MSVALQLKLRDLSWLGQAFTEKSIISPLGPGKLDEFTAEDRERLRSSGVIGEENTVKPEYYALLETLAKADGFLDLTFRRGPLQARKLIMIYGERKVAAEYHGDDAVFQMPAKPLALANFIGDYTGKSPLNGSDLDLELPLEEGFALTAVFDLYRKAVFKAYAEEEVFVYAGFTLYDLIKVLNEIRESSQSLAYHLFALTGEIPEFDWQRVQELLESLLEKGLLKKDGAKHWPAGEALFFAGNFLIIENIITLTVGRVKDKALDRSGFVLLQAGPLDMLYMEKSGDNLILNSLAPLKAVELLGEVLSSSPMIA